ncbi:MAG: NAD(P)(+) transhydrogenase (Re/Si-specific) subunit beta [Acidobacteriota bacterium]
MSFVESTLVPALYLLSAVLFILGLKGLTRVKTAQRGNLFSAVAMLVAVLATLLELGQISYTWILAGLAIGGLIGAVGALKVEMTSMPEMVALLNGSGGGASALVAASLLWGGVIEPDAGSTAWDIMGPAPAITTVLSLLIGALTLSGSVIAFMKLSGKMSGNPILLPGRHVVNALLLSGSLGLGLWGMTSVAEAGTLSTVAAAVLVLAFALGIMLVIPIGGADMPVVISLLNSYSGIAASATGFVLMNNVLIISGALVGASGLILTQIMCVAMNRTLSNVLFGGFGGEEAAGAGTGAAARDYGPVKSYSSEEAALVLENAESVVFVPGYGLAVAQAQHTVRDLAALLEKRGAKVTYGIHPVAGRMPGHMNVLLAEADVPYDQLLEMDLVNPEFRNTDVVIVVGANDVVNPAAEKSEGSPIYGMPVLEVWNAGTIIMIKRSLSPGFAGIKNELFEYDNTMMLFEDAKKAVQGIVTELKELE